MCSTDSYVDNTLEKTEGTIKNEQSRHTANIGLTRHRMKIDNKKKHNTTQKLKI